MPPRLRLLHTIHDFLPRHQAGSEIYTATLCQELQRRGHHVTVLATSFDPSRRHGDVVWRVHDGLPVVEIVNNWIFESFEDTYRAANLRPVFDHVLRATEPDVLHVHSLLNLSFDLPQMARAHGARVVGTLHDYTLVCASGGQRIHRAEQHVCHTIDPDRCARCFAQSPFPVQIAFGRAINRRGGSLVHRVARVLRRRAPRLLTQLTRIRTHTAPPQRLTGADIAARIYAARAAAGKFDLIVAPSRSIAHEFRALDVAPTRIEVADYGFQQTSRSAPTVASAGPLRVGYVGTLVWHKGVHVLIEAVRQVPAGAVEVLIFGDADTFPDYAADLQAAARDLPVRFMGRFARDRVADVYAQFDVLAVPSLWLENSPLVIHEAFMTGTPIVGARIGGIADLIREGENGLLYSPDSTRELADALHSLARDRSRLATLSARPTPVTSIEEDAAAWERRYSSILASHVPDRRAS